MAGEGHLAQLEQTSQIDWKRFISSGAIVLSWLYLNRSALQWLGQALQEAAQFNVLMLGFGAVLLLVQLWRYRQSLTLSSVPRLRPLPLALLLGSGLAAIASRWLITLDHFPVLLFLLGTYGLLGLFLNVSIWRKGLPLAVAIACILPFGTQFSTGLGFPVRILTARAVEQILQTWHITALSSENIIVLENGIANVDLPCSGTKSLWTGALVLLAATWLENRQVGLRWLLVCATNFALLILTNIGRVLVLVLLVQVLQRSDIAEILHAPLGIIGFVTASVLTLVLLKWVPQHSASPIEAATFSGGSSRMTAGMAQTVLVACLIGMTVIPQPRSLATEPLDLTDFQLPASIQVQPFPLAPAEQTFFASYPGTVAQKYRFDAPTLSGSMLLVSGSTWRAQHTPELCLVGMGFEVSNLEAKQLTSDILGRWLVLNQGTYSAAYWFQSPHRTTNDFLARIWQEVTRQEPTWVMASILFNQAQNSNDPEVRQFLTAVHDAVDRNLQTQTANSGVNS